MNIEKKDRPDILYRLYLKRMHHFDGKLATFLFFLESIVLIPISSCFSKDGWIEVFIFLLIFFYMSIYISGILSFNNNESMFFLISLAILALNFAIIVYGKIQKNHPFFGKTNIWFILSMVLACVIILENIIIKLYLGKGYINRTMILIILVDIFIGCIQFFILCYMKSCGTAIRESYFYLSAFLPLLCTGLSVIKNMVQNYKKQQLYLISWVLPFITK